MLTSLIAVLVLLVIGFYAATIAAVGRAGAGEAQLSRSRRLALALAGVSALGLAYAIYRHPIGSGDPLTQANASAWSAAPAQTLPRSSEVAAEMAAETAQPAEPPAAAEAPRAADPAPAAPAPVENAEPPEPVIATREPPAAAAPAPGLSASAAAMEAELLRRRQGLSALPGEPEPTAFAASEPVAKPAPAAAAVASPSAVVEGAPAAKAAPAPAPRVATRRAPTTVASPRAAPVSIPSPPRLGYAPLTILIHNQLGAAQQSERLALLIEGKRVASFEITEAAPSISLPIRLPRPGLLHYRIEGESQQGGRLGLQGEGCIRAVDGASFQVRRRGSDSRQVFLETVNG